MLPCPLIFPLATGSVGGIVADRLQWRICVEMLWVSYTSQLRRSASSPRIRIRIAPQRSCRQDPRLHQHPGIFPGGIVQNHIALARESLHDMHILIVKEAPRPSHVESTNAIESSTSVSPSQRPTVYPGYVASIAFLGSCVRSSVGIYDTHRIRLRHRRPDRKTPRPCPTE